MPDFILLDASNADEDEIVDNLLAEVLKKYDYNPDQPRDDLGRWVDSGGMLQGNTPENSPVPKSGEWIDPAGILHRSGGTSGGGQRQLPGVPRAGVVGKDRSEMERKLASAPVANTEPLGGGMMVTVLATLEDGTKAVFKPKDGENGYWDAIPNGEYYLREVAVSDVAEVLGMTDMVGKAVVREIDGRIGSLAQYMNDTLDVARNFASPSYDIAPDVAGRIAAFDFIIGNHDRHNGNWVTDENYNKIALIDHGLSFPEFGSNSMSGSNFSIRVRDEEVSISDAIGNSWDDKWKGIEAALVSRGLTKAIDGAKWRFNDLIAKKNAGETFAELGA